MTGRHEPDESRDSRPDLWAARGEIPRADPAEPDPERSDQGSAGFVTDNLLGPSPTPTLSSCTIGAEQGLFGPTLAVVSSRFWIGLLSR